MGFRDFYRHGASARSTRKAGYRVGAEIQMPPATITGDAAFQQLYAKGLAAMNASPHQYYGFAFNTSGGLETQTADDEQTIDDWYGNIVDRSDVYYAITWHKASAAPNATADMINEYRVDPSGGSASGKVTGPSSGEIVMKQAAPSTPSTSSGTGKIAVVIGGLMASAVLVIAVTGKRTHQ